MGSVDYLKARTIEEMVERFYAAGGRPPIGIFKADDPLLSSTSGAWNPVYGAKAWAQLNMDASGLGILPKTKWSRSGWRVITGMGGSTADGGLSEDGTLPDTTKPTIQEIKAKPKQIVHGLEVSMMQELLSQTEDDAYGDMETLRAFYRTQHVKRMNEQVWADVEAQAASASGDYTGTNNLESLDRIISSSSEEAAFGGTYNGWYDPWDGSTVDRDSGTTFDSYVDHNSGTDRSLTDEMIRTAISSIYHNSGQRPTVIVTGHDTYAKIQGLYSELVRYNPLGATKVQVGLNGIQTASGIEAGIDVATIYNIPIIVSADVPQDTISRIYFLNTNDVEGYGAPWLGFDVLMPTAYYESKDPIVVNKLNTQGFYVTMGEVKCRNFRGQGKIRDLA